MDGGKFQPMTPEAASRIQSAEARKNDGIVEKGYPSLHFTNANIYAVTFILAYFIINIC